LQVDKEKLKELMKKNEIKNFTQLAICLGISKNQLSNILSDKFNPIKSNIVDLAKYFEVSPSEIISEKNKKRE
jgi:DNA (cytosine-5)-methyltransferase 1